MHSRILRPGTQEHKVTVVIAAGGESQLHSVVLLEACKAVGHQVQVLPIVHPSFIARSPFQLLPHHVRQLNEASPHLFGTSARTNVTLRELATHALEVLQPLWGAYAAGE